MSASSSALVRWLKFNLVGAVGICVQLATLALLKSIFGLNYLLATTLAVEVTIIHNFVWHERFTWAGRATTSRLRRLAAFNLSNGAISLLGNLAMMDLLVEVFGLNYFCRQFSRHRCLFVNKFCRKRSIRIHAKTRSRLIHVIVLAFH